MYIVNKLYVYNIYYVYGVIIHTVHEDFLETNIQIDRE